MPDGWQACASFFSTIHITVLRGPYCFLCLQGSEKRMLLPTPTCSTRLCPKTKPPLLFRAHTAPMPSRDEHSRLQRHRVEASIVFIESFPFPSYPFLCLFLLESHDHLAVFTYTLAPGAVVFLSWWVGESAMLRRED